MKETGYREAAVYERRLPVEYDLADAIYAACLADLRRKASPFYFMDAEDGGTALRARERYHR